MVRVSGGKRRAGHSELESVYPIRRFGKPALVQGVTYALAASIFTVSRLRQGFSERPALHIQCADHRWLAACLFLKPDGVLRLPLRGKTNVCRSIDASSAFPYIR